MAGLRASCKVSSRSALFCQFLSQFAAGVSFAVKRLRDRCGAAHFAELRDFYSKSPPSLLMCSMSPTLTSRAGFAALRWSGCVPVRMTAPPVRGS